VVLVHELDQPAGAGRHRAHARRRFLIEDGKLVSAVNNFRFNESVAKVFERCHALGSEAPLVELQSRCPAVRTHEFNLASVSDAV
jgi:predicted Zn-dependent protease